MFTLAVAVLLRIGEAVPKSKNASFVIRCRDWNVVGPQARSLFLQRSKCDQRGKGVLLRRPSVDDARVDAVRAVDSYIAKSPVVLPPDGPLFVLENGSPLIRPVVIAVLRQAARTPPQATSPSPTLMFEQAWQQREQEQKTATSTFMQQLKMMKDIMTLMQPATTVASLPQLTPLTISTEPTFSLDTLERMANMFKSPGH